MNKKIFFYKYLIFVVLIACSCKEDNIKIKKYEYYQSGKLKSEGFFIRDSLPVDTIKNYFENGSLKSIEIRDDSGKLNGISKIFYKNGTLRQIIPYVNDRTQGFVWFFSISGKLMQKEFYFNNLQVGDIFYFDSSGKIDGYRFKDFKGKSLIQIDYDINGNINKENRQVLFIDSFILRSNRSENKKLRNCDILIIMSNPPKCNTTIKISFWDKGKVYKTDNVAIGHYYKATEKIRTNTDSIIVFSKQYDSIIGKEKYEKSITPVLPPS